MNEKAYRIIKLLLMVVAVYILFTKEFTQRYVPFKSGNTWTLLDTKTGTLTGFSESEPLKKSRTYKKEVKDF